MNDKPFSEEGYALMGAAFEVHNEMGGGLREEIYQQSLEKELALRNMPFATRIGGTVRRPQSEVLGDLPATDLQRIKEPAILTQGAGFPKRRNSLQGNADGIFGEHRIGDADGAFSGAVESRLRPRYPVMDVFTLAHGLADCRLGSGTFFGFEVWPAANANRPTNEPDPNLRTRLMRTHISYLNKPRIK